MSDAYPKFDRIPRLNRDMVVTEKIDGTNGLISIEEKPFRSYPGRGNSSAVTPGPADGENKQVPVLEYHVRAGSRNRWLTPESDNFGFAAWVYANVVNIVADLGPGMHYGEWWGSGIQRGYGLSAGQKRFSLFNTARRGGIEFTTPGLGVVPVLDRYAFSLTRINIVLEKLRVNGSQAQPGFMNPEGVVVYHTAANQMFKVTLENDDKPKSLVLA